MSENPAPVLLVSSMGLGSLNHAIMSVRLLQEQRLPLLGVVLNEERDFSSADLSAQNALWGLQQQLALPIHGPLRRGRHGENREALKPLLQECFA